MLESSVKTILEILLTVTYIYPFLWSKTVQIFPFIDPSSEFQRGMAFFLLEFIRSKLFDLPFTLYFSFVIEERHGFNKKTLKLFFKDMFLEFLLISIISPILLFFYIYLIENGGRFFFIYVELFLIIFIFIMMWIYPNFIAPLFNKFTELEKDYPDLLAAITTLSNSIKFPLKKVYIMDGSTRSAHSNAYFYGFGNNKRIVLFDTLVKQMKEKEIVAVMGHELGHWKMAHMPKNLALIIIKTTIYIYMLSFFLNEPGLYLSYGFNEKSILMGSLLFSNLISPVEFLTSFKENKEFFFSRSHISWN